jgi:hypothetical protein
MEIIYPLLNLADNTGQAALLAISAVTFGA